MKNYIEVNHKAYNLLAKEYLKRVNKSTEPLENLAGIPLSHAKKYFKSISAFEIGPGSGEVCRYLSRKKCKTTALDIAEDILKVVNAISPKTKLILGDILTYKIPKENYQFIYCGALIHLFAKKDAKRIMNNIYNSLKSKGILFCNTTIHDKSSEGFYVKNDYCGRIKRFRHRYTEKEFSNLISKKFKIIDRIDTIEKDRKKHWVAFIAQKISK